MSFLVCANSIIEHYHFFVPFFSFRNYFTRSKKKLGFAKKKFYVIIKQQREKRRRLKLKNEQLKKKRKNEKV